MTSIIRVNFFLTTFTGLIIALFIIIVIIISPSQNLFWPILIFRSFEKNGSFYREGRFDEQVGG